MKNAKEMQMEKIITALEKAGVDASRLSLAESYLLGETELPDFGMGQKLNAAAVDYKVTDAISKTGAKYLRAKSYDEFLRLFNVVFELFYNVQRLILIYELREAIKADENFKNMLPKEKVIVMLAERYEGYNLHYMNYVELWDISGESHQVLKKSLELCKKNSLEGKLSIYCTYFMFLKKTAGDENKSKQTGKNWGILGGLCKVFGAKENKEAGNAETDNFTEEDAELFKQYESLIVENSGLVFYNMPEDNRKRVVEYVRNGGDGEDIPDDIKAFAGKYSMYGSASVNLTPRRLIGNCINNSRYSVRFRNFIRLCLYGNNLANTLDIMMAASKKFTDVDGDKVRELVLMWRKSFSPDTVKLICWCAEQGVHNNYNKTLLWFADEEPDAYREAIDTSSAKICGRLSELIKQERPSLYEKHYKSDTKKEKMQRDLAEKFAVKIDDKNKNAVINYLLTGDSLENLYNIEKSLMITNSYYAEFDEISSLNNYISMLGKDNFSKRCVVFLGFRGYYNSMLRFFSKDGWRDLKPEKEKELFCDFNDMGLSIAKQWQIGCGITQTIYLEKLKNEHREVLRDIFSDYVNVYSDECVTAFSASDVDGRALAIDILGTKNDVYKKEIFEYFGDGSKVVKEAMVKLLKEKKDWMPDVLEKLGSRKAAERELAVAIIGQCGGYTEELRKALETEKSSKVAGAIRGVLGEGDKQCPQGEVSAESYVKELHKGGKKRALAWAYETPFTEVHMLSDEGTGNAATEEYMQAILLAYSSMPVPGVNKEVLKLTNALNQAELAQYVTELFDKWRETGAEAKKKWVLYVAGIHGGAQIVELMKHQIDEWAKNSRGAIAAEAVKALALNSSPTALLMVDGIARKYKFKQVRAAASKALEFAAEQLGLSTEELADRIVPDLGFNEQHERIFDYGERKFKVYITPALEIEIFDENGKKLKNMPAPGKRDDELLAAESYAEFKQMKKQMKATVANQKLRLEAALSTERKWQTDSWRALFVENPIMHQFAISLIWGVYGEDGTVIATFRYMEDGSFNTEDEEEYQLPEKGMIGLIHPIELSADSKAKWEEQLSDYEITQSVEQLKRPVFALTEEEKHAKALERFGGAVLAAISLSGKLQTMGWYKGAAEDAGIYYYFYREDTSSGIRVLLNFSGAYIGDSYTAAENEEVTVYDAEFYKKASNGKEKQKLTLGELSPKYFSEIVYQLTKATAGVEEWDKNWRADR